MRRLTKRVQRELDSLPVPWEVVQKKAHYFLRVDGQPLVCIGGNTKSPKRTTESNCIANIRRLRKEYERTDR